MPMAFGFLRVISSKVRLVLKGQIRSDSTRSLLFLVVDTGRLPSVSTRNTRRLQLLHKSNELVTAKTCSDYACNPELATASRHARSRSAPRRLSLVDLGPVSRQFGWTLLAVTAVFVAMTMTMTMTMTL
jgi:hypothetical protein